MIVNMNGNIKWVFLIVVLKGLYSLVESVTKELLLKKSVHLSKQKLQIKHFKNRESLQKNN